MDTILKLLIELFFWYGVLKILEGISCFISLIVNINTATFEFKDIILKMLFCLSLGIIIIKITYSRIDFSFLLGRWIKIMKPKQDDKFFDKYM